MKSSTTTIRWLIVIGLPGTVLSFFALGWQHQLTLDALKVRQQRLDAYRQAHSWLLDAGFFLVSVACAALSLAAATLLILAGGALFGLLEGRLLMPFDTLLIAVGRQPRASGFGLDELGIRAAKTVDTDAYLATLYPNIHACRDVAGPHQFTHVAAHQEKGACARARAPVVGPLSRLAIALRAPR